MPSTAQRNGKSARRNKPAKVSPRRLAEIKARAEISDDEMRELRAEAAEGFERIETIDGLLAQLRAARERGGLSLAQLDERTGIGRSNLSRLENGHVPNPTLDTILRYAQGVGVQLRLEVAPNAPSDE